MLLYTPLQRMLRCVYIKCYYTIAMMCIECQDTFATLVSVPVYTASVGVKGN